MSSGFRVLENQDWELGIGDVGSLFGWGEGRVFRLIVKFAALFLGEKWCHQFLCACCMKHAAHHLILKVPDVLGNISLWHLNVLIVFSKFRDQSFITSWGRGGGWDFKGGGLILGGNFENAQNVRGVEILRHRTGLLCKSCQTILWLKKIHVSFKRSQKNTLWRFFVSNKMLPV